MRSKRKIFGILMAAVMSSTIFVGTAFGKNAMLKVDGILYSFETEPITEQDTMLVPMKDVFSALGVDVAWDLNTKTATAKKDKDTLVLTAGKKEAYLNGDRKYQPVAPKMSNTTLMVPVRFVCEAFGANVNWDAVNKTVEVTSKGMPLVVFDRNKSYGADVEVITYEDGLKRALNAKSSIKNLEESVEYWKEQMKTNRNNYVESLQVGLEAASINLERANKALEMQIINSADNERIIKDSVELMYRSYLTQIEGHNVDLQILQESIGMGQINVKNMELKNSLGMVSDSELKKAKQDLQQLKTKYEALEISLKNARMELNKLMELPAGKNTMVLFEPQVRRLDINIDSFITAKISEDPTIKMARDAISQAEYMRDTSSERLLNELMIDMENDVNKAARDLYDAENNMEKAMRSAYNNIKQMETNQKSLELDLEKAKDDYKNAVASYEAGMITMYEIQMAKLGILQAEAAIDKNAYQYSTLVYQLEHPYLLSSASRE